MIIAGREVSRRALWWAVGGVVAAVSLWFAVTPVVSRAPRAGVVKVRPQTSVEAVGDSVAAVAGRDFADRVVRVLRLTGTDMQNRQGAYKVRAGESALVVARHLAKGAQCGVRVTFNNIRTRRQWADRMAQQLMLDADDLLPLLADSARCAAYGFTTDNITAMLLPDTYEFFWTVSAEKLLDRLHGYYERFWTQQRVSLAAAEGLTPADVAIVASIVEEETAKADERGRVARLYLNRLHDGMPLQADPTVKFALGDFGIRRLSVAMTRTESAYNTYRVRGLPPGPIRLPEKATLDAVLHAPKHNYLYMCAKDDFSGYHNFAADYATHMANARRYQAALDARGIKR